MNSSLFQSLAQKQIVVCVGPGGVGKTTIAASIALQSAMNGRKTVVCTIDPAQRLANSLGLKKLDHHETLVPLGSLPQPSRGLPAPLYATILDTSQTWNDLISRHAPPDRIPAILENRFYRQISSSMVGSQEFAAMEKIALLSENQDYDLLVLDTPPTSHALDFLEAPTRILDFFGDEKALRLLGSLLPLSKSRFRAMHMIGEYFVRSVARLTGMQLLKELAELLSNLAPLHEVFVQRATWVKELLASPKAAFVLVTNPSAPTVDESIAFHRLLVQQHLPLTAIVANRVHPPLPASDLDEISGPLASHLSSPSTSFTSPLAERIKRILSDAQALAERDQQQLGRLNKSCLPSPVFCVPRQIRDVCEVTDLWRICQSLFSYSIRSHAYYDSHQQDHPAFSQHCLLT